MWFRNRSGILRGVAQIGVHLSNLFGPFSSDVAKLFRGLQVGKTIPRGRTCSVCCWFFGCFPVGGFLSTKEGQISLLLNILAVPFVVWCSFPSPELFLHVSCRLGWSYLKRCFVCDPLSRDISTSSPDASKYGVVKVGLPAECPAV